MKRERIQPLFEKYLQGSLTAEEASELQEYMDDPSLEPILRQTLNKSWDRLDKSGADIELEVEGVTKNLENNVLQHIGRLEKRSRKIVPLYWRYAAALAVIFSALGLIIYTLNKNSVTIKDGYTYGNVEDVAPGTNKATLLLANGKKIELSEKMESIQVTGNFIRYGNGEIVVDHTVPQDLLISVPRGGKYELQLSDGTKVWLNAASSLKYPSTFIGDQRVVELMGEAYFEVQHDSRHPFIVKTETQTVKVLGTSFNINTYRKKEVTTLVQGKIALHTAKGDEKILSPGDQATINANRLTVGKVNTQDYTAWKDGLIVLNDQDLQEIFHQLERWYDVEFVNGELAQANHRTLSGEIPRNTNLSAILQALEEQINVKFEIKGRRIMIRN